MPEFKYYIVYGDTEGLNSLEDYNEAFKKYGEVLKKYNMELKFWGGAWGASEGIVCVLKGKIEDYQSMMGNPDYREANPIKVGQRTNMVLKF